MFSVSQKGEIFVRGKSIDKSSFGFSILAPYKNSDHSDARATKPAMKKGCDHVRSPFWFDGQSHVILLIEVVNFWGQNQLSRVSLDSQSNFSGVRIDLFTDKAAILSLLDLRIIMG